MNVYIRKSSLFPPTYRHLALEMSGRFFLLLVCFMLFGVGLARSQSGGTQAAIHPNITPLNIGDQIPDALWNTPLTVVNHPQGKQTITLADYKGKLIILDFWATWCVPCIRNFPKLHALQNEFGDKIKVLAVTQEDTDRISKFFKTGAGKEHTYVNSVINDNALSTYFPHKSVPHIAWISPDGKVLNTTQAEDITTTNIQAILDNQKTQMVAKVDIDRDRPLFLSEHFSNDLQLKSYSIFVKGYYPGLPSGNKLKRTKDGKMYGRQMTNATMMNIYYAILYTLFDDLGEKFNSKRMIIEVNKSALLNLIKKADGGYEHDNLYNYELIVPEDKADSLFHYMLKDLNRYSDYTGTIEKRMVDCLILVRTSTKDKIKSKGGKPENIFPAARLLIRNYPISHMVNALNGDTFIKLPVIDETGYTDNVDIEISWLTDLTNLKKELNRYDLDLKAEKRNLNMFVLKDK